jgi:hypothetical protein
MAVYLAELAVLYGRAPKAGAAGLTQAKPKN